MPFGNLAFLNCVWNERAWVAERQGGIEDRGKKRLWDKGSEGPQEGKDLCVSKFLSNIVYVAPSRHVSETL